MYCVLACTIVPATSFRNSAPLRFCAIVVYACKAAAINERAEAYRCYAVGNCYACQTAAITERKRAYRRDTVGNCYACQTAAIAERVRRDYFNIVTYSYGC